MLRCRDILLGGLNIVKVRVFKRRIPITVTIMVTNRCNLKCRYCQIPPRIEKELSTQEIFRIIDELQLLGTRRISIGGGEPLLRSDIREIIEHCKEKGLYTSLFSNGWYVAQKIEELKYLDKVMLSLDGKKEIHDWLRGKDSYERAISAIRILREHKISVWSSTVLTKYNIDQIDFILEKAKEYGLAALFQTAQNNSRSGKIEDFLFASHQEYRAAIQKLIEKKRERYPIVNSKTYLRYLLSWPDYKEFLYRGNSISTKYKAKKCFAGRNYCNIDVNGDLYPCFALMDKMQTSNCVGGMVKNALLDIKLPEQNCLCTVPCSNEYDYVLSGKWEPILNALRYL